jgi:hypothetical protein
VAAEFVIVWVGGCGCFGGLVRLDGGWWMIAGTYGIFA